MSWFRCYLSDRKQVIKVDGVNASWRSNLCGVLDPGATTIFLVDSRISLYVDDTVLYYLGNSFLDITLTVRDGMKQLGKD